MYTYLYASTDILYQSGREGNPNKQVSKTLQAEHMASPWWNSFRYPPPCSHIRWTTGKHLLDFNFA